MQEKLEGKGRTEEVDGEESVNQTRLNAVPLLSKGRGEVKTIPEPSVTENVNQDGRRGETKIPLS